MTVCVNYMPGCNMPIKEIFFCKIIKLVILLSRIINDYNMPNNAKAKIKLFIFLQITKIYICFFHVYKYP